MLCLQFPNTVWAAQIIFTEAEMTLRVTFASLYVVKLKK